jgi:hypothetical protein
MIPRIILDTDLGGDIDDLGALALLHAYADAGRCILLGVVSDTPQAPAITCIHATNTYYGRPALPVGRPREVLRPEHKYADAVAARFPSLPKPENAPLADDLYRALLAAQPDGSVTIACIGWQHQTLALLRTGPDRHSPLDGRALVARKVARFVIMGGYGDQGDHSAPEPNFNAANTPGITRDFIALCPAPISFIPAELGDRTLGYGTGARLVELPEDNPVRIGYADFFSRPPAWTGVRSGSPIQPWSIWDQLTCHHAVVGPDEWLGVQLGKRNEVDELGLNHWVQDPSSIHALVVPLRPPSALAHDLVEPLMLGLVASDALALG